MFWYQIQEAPWLLVWTIKHQTQQVPTRFLSLWYWGLDFWILCPGKNLWWGKISDPNLSPRFLNIMFMDNLVMGRSTVEERASNPLNHVAATHRAERRNHQNLECLQWSEKCQIGTMGLWDHVAATYRAERGDHQDLEFIHWSFNWLWYNCMYSIEYNTVLIEKVTNIKNSQILEL